MDKEVEQSTFQVTVQMHGVRKTIVLSSFLSLN